jgi:hypothetical protein
MAISKIPIAEGKDDAGTSNIIAECPNATVQTGDQTAVNQPPESSVYTFLARTE